MIRADSLGKPIDPIPDGCLGDTAEDDPIGNATHQSAGWLVGPV